MRETFAARMINAGLWIVRVDSALPTYSRLRRLHSLRVNEFRAHNSHRVLRKRLSFRRFASEELRARDVKPGAREVDDYITHF
jgi:hypothetical protein